MKEYIEQLTRLFSHFPGIGEKQARRFAYFVVAQKKGYINELCNTIEQAHSEAHTCESCFCLYSGNPPLCPYCSDPRRNTHQILVIEKTTDIEKIAQTPYEGKFFVLENLIPIVEKRVVKKTNLAMLLDRLVREKNLLKEVILALPLTPHGIHTDEVIREEIRKSFNESVPFLITSLGRGLSFGTEIEYADTYSLRISFEQRK